MNIQKLLRIAAITGILSSLAVLALAQNPDVPVKDTAASRSLAKLAKDADADNKSLGTNLQQARASLDANSKALTGELTKARKDLEDKLKQDKHYKPMLDHIDDLQKQVAQINQKAEGEYQKSSGPIQQKIQMELAQMQGLIPVVKEENGFPAEAQFNPQTGKWTLPAKK